VGAVVLVQNQQNAVTVDATAALNPVQGGPLPASDGRLGTAELITTRTGQEQVRVDASRLPPTTSASYEVWLFGNDGRMVSLGTLADGTGTFTMPMGIDTREYRTVDISDEPPDGNPAHSGISLIRGTFT
jgi:anti-sigma-K factor RskA